MERPARRRIAVALALLSPVAGTGLAAPGLAPTPLAAQTSLVLEPSAGVAIPLGALEDIADPGFAVGGAVTCFFHPNIGLRGQVQGEFLNDRVDPFGVVPSPPLTLLHVTGGFEVNFAPPAYQVQPLTFRIQLGGGATHVSGDATYGDGSSVDFSRTYPTVTGGVQLGYRLAPRVEAFAGAAAHLVLFDEEDTEVFAARSQQVDTFSEGWSLPVSAGLRLGL